MAVVWRVPDRAEAMPDVAVSRGIKLLPKVGRYLPEWHRKCGFTRRHEAVTRAYLLLQFRWRVLCVAMTY
jgi:hypothetical protein